MAFNPTRSMERVFSLKQRIRAVAGGTSAGKTIAILVWLIDYAQTRKNKIVWVVSESMPHLKGGAMQDFQNIMTAHGYWDDKRWNASDHIYTFETGTKIKFTSVDTYGKAHGARRDVLFINECNYLPYNIVDQLVTRTREVVWLDWNPTAEFWFYEKMEGRRKDLDFITLTYKDNDSLEQSVIDEIESHKDDANWWRVYGEGKLGVSDDRVYDGWRIIDEIPFEASLLGYGLDFGYAKDPTAIVAVYKYNGGFILDEICYRKGLSNKQIADLILAQDYGLVVADSSEPKSIDEIASYGVEIVGAKKGKDSVSWGINYVRGLRISMTKQSVNLIKEYRNYIFIKNKSGQVLNTPIDYLNHAMDAVRYRLTMTDSGRERKKSYQTFNSRVLY